MLNLQQGLIGKTIVRGMTCVGWYAEEAHALGNWVLEAKKEHPEFNVVGHTIVDATPIALQLMDWK